ncbi:hypothetical protein QR680_014537 [Steinernema hermaphroditum]|uniref:Peptidase M13 C-terminal domain-containing protein n=1 Tax=Steinernema hermaphroditum TaxID=289476 RepID=A0AA39M477_9BILA|nr:hypothetical protein QR680_014537 [Steinernema hermaphroditum]
MFCRTAVLLVLLHLLCVHTFSITHKFSSSVHPCDDFETFVCNEAENVRLGSPLHEQRHGFYDKIKEAFVNDDDVIINEIKKIYAGPDVTFDVTFPYDLSSDTRSAILTFHNEANNSTTTIATCKMKDYLNLLLIKYISENELFTARRKVQLYTAYNEALAEFLSVLEKTTALQPAVKAEYKNLFETKRLVLSFQDPLTNVNLIKANINQIQSGFFELKSKSTPCKESDKDCQTQQIVSLLQKAYNESVDNNKLQMKFKSFSIDPLQEKIDEPDEGNGPYSNAFFVPPSGLFDLTENVPFGIRFANTQSVFLEKFFVELMYFIFTKNGRRQHYMSAVDLKCKDDRGIENMYIGLLSSMRSTAKMLAKTNDLSNTGPFTNLQWYYIAVQAQICNDAHSRMDRFGLSDIVFKQSPLFQKAFNCRPGQKLFTDQKNMCPLL